jgi:drug/metabolite transporter (DMT)-like permease
MPTAAFLLLFVSALLHTSWNLLLKGASLKPIATWWATVLGAVVFAPLLIFTGPPPREVWGLLITSVIIEVAYWVLLAYAYQDGDFSLVYPVARGTAPAFLALWSVLFLHETLSRGGLAGLGLIVTGLVIIGGGGLLRGPGTKPQLFTLLAALTIALLISIYTAVDGTAVKRAPALPYALAIFTLVPLLAAPLMRLRFSWPELGGEWSAHWRRISAIGVLSVLAYLFALRAYTIAPIAYAGAIREVSVVMAAFAGWRLLGESMGRLRVAGSLVIFMGILMIAVLG